MSEIRFLFKSFHQSNNYIEMAKTFVCRANVTTFSGESLVSSCFITNVKFTDEPYKSHELIGVGFVHCS